MLKWQQIMGVIFYQSLMLTSLLKCVLLQRRFFHSPHMTREGGGRSDQNLPVDSATTWGISAISLFSLYNLTSLFTCNFWFKISPNYHLKLQKESNYLSIISFHLVNRENIIFLWIHCAGKAGHKHPSKWKRLSLLVHFGQGPFWVTWQRRQRHK